MISKNDSFLSSDAKKELESLEILLENELSKGNRFMSKEALRLLKGGGKRIRPLLTILFSMLGESYDSEKALAGAAALETLHMATLIHDDTIDNAGKRRGIDTTFKKHGVHTAIYTGDWMFVKSLQLLSSAQNDSVIKKDLLSMLSKAMESVCEGEINQYYARGTLPEVSKYFSRIRDKTASLFVAACIFGATNSGLSKAKIKLASEFGENFGMAFQILDDIIDIKVSAKAAGKPVINDLNEGIITLPVIFACQKSTAFKKSVVAFLKNPNAVILSEIRDESIALGGVDLASEKCMEYINKSLSLLKKFPDTKGREDIKNVVLSVFSEIIATT